MKYQCLTLSFDTVMCSSFLCLEDVVNPTVNGKSILGNIKIATHTCTWSFEQFNGKYFYSKGTRLEPIMLA